MSEIYYSEQDSFSVVHPEQDLRDLPVVNAAGQPLGRVRDLIFNTVTERVDFLELYDGSRILASDVDVQGQRVVVKPLGHVI